MQDNNDPLGILGDKKTPTNGGDPLGILKKKGATVSPSEPKQEPISSVTQPKGPQKPSVSSVSGKDEGLYSYPGNELAVYKKTKDEWLVDWNRSGNFMQLQKGDVAKRVAALEKNAKKLYDADYEKSLTWKPEPKPEINKNREQQTQNQKQAQKLFESTFKVLSSDDPIVIERNKVEQLSKDVSNYVNKSEEQTVEDLTNKFKGTKYDIFNFEETGMGDMLKITNKKTDQNIVIDLDGSENEKNILQAFIESNLSFREYNDLIEKRNNINKELLSPTLSGLKQVELERELSNINNKIKEQELYRKGYALSKGTYATTAMYGKQNLKDIDQKFKDSSSRLIGLSVILKEDAKKSSDFEKKLKEDYSNGLITKEQYDATLNDKAYQFQKQQIKDRYNELKEDAKSIKEDRDLMEKIVAESRIAKEERGDIGSNILANFAYGFVSPYRMLIQAQTYTNPVYDSKGNRLYDQEVLSKEAFQDILPGVITDEYITSEKRSDFERAIVGVAESLGAVAAIPIGGGAAKASTEVAKRTGIEIVKNISRKALLSPSQLGLFASSYMNFKDQINSDPETAKIDEADKVLLSGAYAYVSSKLESFGMSKWFTKSPAGTKITSYVMSKVFKDLPKDATQEMIDNKVNSSVKALIAKGAISLTAKGNVEGTTEALQELADITLKSVYNEMKGEDIFQNPSFPKIIDRMSESYKLGLIGGTIMSSTSQILSTAKESRTAIQLKQLDNIISDPNLKKMFEDDVKVRVLSGEITKEQGENELREINDSASIMNEIPDYVKDKTESFKLISEKRKIEKEIAGKDDNLIATQKARIAEIDNQLKTIGENAVKESTKPVEEVTAEGGGVQREGTQEGQPEVGQGEGAVGQAAQPEANLSDRAVEGRGAEEALKDVESTAKALNEDLVSSIEEAANILFPKNEETNTIVSEAYHADKAAGKETDLTKAVEQLLGKPAEVVPAQPAAVEEEIKTNYTDENYNVIFENPNYIVRGGAGKNSSEGYYTWDRSEAIQYADGNEENIFEGELKSDSNILELETNNPTNYKEIKENVKIFEKITGLKYTPEEFSDIYGETRDKLKKAGYDAVRGSTIDGLAIVVLNKNAINPIIKPTAVEETVTVEQPVVEEVAVDEEVERLGRLLEGTDEQIDEEVGKLRISKDNNKVAQSISNAAKAIAKILPDVKFVVHDTDESYRKATGEQNRKQSTAGEYNPKTRTIHINGTKANNRTAAHEVFHAVILEGVKNNAEAQRLAKAMINAVMKSLVNVDGAGNVISYLKDFSSNYEQNIQNEEKLAELFGILADNYATLPAPTQSLIRRFLDRLAKIFGLKPLTDREVIDFMNVVSQKVARGEEIQVREIPGISRIKIKELSSRFQANDAFNGAMEKLGIKLGTTNEKTGKTKVTNYDVASALNEYYSKKHEKISITDFSKNASDIVSDYAKNEILFAISTFGENSGKGWYTEDYNSALNILSSLDKDISKDKNIKEIATAIIAVASNSTDVYTNLTRVIYGINKFKSDGIVPNNVGVGKGASAIASGIDRYNNILSRFEGDPTKVADFLQQIDTISNLKKKLISEFGLSSYAQALNNNLATDPEWNDNETLPMSVLIFGPKIGAFYSNLSGLDGTPTIDRWCIRTLYRYRGDMRSKVSEKEMEDFKSTNGIENVSYSEAISLAQEHSKLFDAILTGRGIYKGIPKEERNLKLKPYRKGSQIWKKAQGVVNDISEGIESGVSNKKQYAKDFRSFTKTAFESARDKVFDESGIKLSVSDVQAILWIYEKNLFGHLGVKQREDATYSAAAKTLTSKVNSKEISFNKLISGDISILSEPDISTDGAMGDIYGSSVSSFKNGIDNSKKRNTENLESISTETKTARKQIDNSFEARNQKPKSITDIINAARQNGFSDAAIQQYLSQQGYSQQQITNAMASVNPSGVTIDDVFKKSQEELESKLKSRSIKQRIVDALRSTRGTMLNRQTDIKRALRGIKNKEAKQTYAKLVDKAGASGFAGLRFKIVAKKIYGKLKESEIKALDSIIYARRVISINENRRKINSDIYEGLTPGMANELDIIITAIRNNSKKDLSDAKKRLGDKTYEDLINRAKKYRKPYTGISIEVEVTDANGNIVKEKRSYNESDAQRDLVNKRAELGDERFNEINRRADIYFGVFEENLKKLKDSGRISEETYNNLKDVEYSPIKTIKYILKDNYDPNDLDKEASRLGISKKDIMSLGDENENGIITDSRWLLMMNLNMLESRVFENQMLNELVSAIENATAEEKVALSDYFILDNPIIGQLKDGRPKRKFDDEALPDGYTRVHYFKDGIDNYIIAKEAIAKQILDVKNSKITPAIEQFNEDVPVLGWLVKQLVLTPGRLLRFFATGGNPFFILGNVPMDWANAVFFNKVYSHKWYEQFKVIAGVKAAWGFVKNFTKSAISKGEWNKIYMEYAEHGGLMETMSQESMRGIQEMKPTGRLAKKLPGILSPIFKSVAGAPYKLLEGYGKAMSYLGETSEIAMRLAVYEKMKSNLIDDFKKENGVNPTGKQLDDIMWEASREARELIDFNQGGSWSKEVDVFLPYFNASMQGLRKPLDYARKNPVGFASSMVQLALMGGSIAIYSIASGLSAFDDEDEEERKKKLRKALDSITAREKANYHIIFTGKKDKDGELQYIRIKKLPIASIITTAAENLVYQKYIEYDNKKTQSIVNKSAIPVLPSEIFSKNPLISGILTYAYNEDTYTGEKVFREPKNKKILPTAEGMFDDKVEGVYKTLAPSLGLSPARSKAFVEKFITNESVNPTINIIYAALNGVFDKGTTFGDEFGVMTEELLKHSSKKFIRNTNKDIIKYNLEDEFEKKEMKRETEIYLKEQKMYNEIKKIYDDKKSLTVGELENMVKNNFDVARQKSELKKYYSFIQNMNMDRSLLDIVYEDNPEVQSMRIYERYGNSIDKQEVEELSKIIGNTGKRINKRTWYYYEKDFNGKIK